MPTGVQDVTGMHPTRRVWLQLGQQDSYAKTIAIAIETRPKTAGKHEALGVTVLHILDS
jgi:hypothetical protein